LRSAFLFSMSTMVLTAQVGQSSLDRFPGAIPIPQRDSHEATITHRLSGVILKLDAESFDLEASDTRIFLVRITRITEKPGELKTGDGVDVLVRDKDGLSKAISIKANPKIARTMESNKQSVVELGKRRTTPLPTILVRPGPQAAIQASAPPAAADSRRGLVEQASVVTSTFLRGLPNYVCRESISRDVSEARKPNWNVVDMVSAEVVFEDGREIYRAVVINGKPSKKSPEESGAWSAGEFGTILGELFAPATAAEFRYVEDGIIEHQPASIYDFKVDRRHSSWRIEVPGQYILPPYEGSVWIDPQSAHALRIEMQAKSIPKAFPRLSVETVVDYDYISLGASEKFLLPVHAKVLSCSRGSNQCERNIIEFRDCHKFVSESTIQFKR
jgi:hypothetical protein